MRRAGLEAYGSDLNPVAALLPWASLNLVGGGKEIQQQVIAAQETAFRAAEEKVAAWGIERSEEGWQAEAYLYCVEVKPEGCRIPHPLGTELDDRGADEGNCETETEGKR